MEEKGGLPVFCLFYRAVCWWFFVVAVFLVESTSKYTICVEAILHIFYMPGTTCWYLFSPSRPGETRSQVEPFESQAVHAWCFCFLHMLSFFFFFSCFGSVIFSCRSLLIVVFDVGEIHPRVVNVRWCCCCWTMVLVIQRLGCWFCVGLWDGVVLFFSRLVEVDHPAWPCVSLRLTSTMPTNYYAASLMRAVWWYTVLSVKIPLTFFVGLFLYGFSMVDWINNK